MLAFIAVKCSLQPGLRMRGAMTLFTYALMDIQRENITFSFTSIPTAEHNLNINTLEMTYL
jgi:hypothetical protein